MKGSLGATVRGCYHVTEVTGSGLGNNLLCKKHMVDPSPNPMHSRSRFNAQGRPFMDYGI